MSTKIPDNLLNVLIYLNRIAFTEIMETSTTPKTAKDYGENERTALLLAVSSLQNEGWRQAERC